VKVAIITVLGVSKYFHRNLPAARKPAVFLYKGVMTLLNALLRTIPPVDELLTDREINKFTADLDRGIVVDTIRVEQERLRQSIINEDKHLISALTEQEEKENYLRSFLKERIIASLSTISASNFQKVINCTGTVLHTNLGRAPLSSTIMDKLIETVTNYSNLEFNLDEGKRGSRYDHVEELIRTLTGAESSMVVNNNAAAVMLALNALAQDKEVIISRGELVEIGGSFRIPEVMKQSGAHLVEVGTTNKTHLNDFEQAINEETGLILKVHTSNYHIVGFTDSVPREELVKLAHTKGLPVIEDLGSGLLFDFSDYGFEKEPTIQEVLDSGIDLVTFSGDKLLGGPQAGIIAGKKELVDKLKKDQLTRALRIDKLSLKALEETLRLYLNPKKALKNIPALNILTLPSNVIKDRAEKLLTQMQDTLPDDKYSIQLEESYSQVGGGAMPTQKLPTWTVTVKHKASDQSDLTEIWSSLRDRKPPVIARLQQNKLIFDPRTIQWEEIDMVAQKMKEIQSGQ